MRASRRSLLVLLLALLAMAGATAPAATQGYAAQYRSAATPDTPATHHDLRDWLRLPVAARHALSTPLPDSWWAVCARTAGAWALPGRSLTDAVTRTAVAIGVAATPSTRAPPARVN